MVISSLYHSPSLLLFIFVFVLFCFILFFLDEFITHYCCCFSRPASLECLTTALSSLALHIQAQDLPSVPTNALENLVAHPSFFASMRKLTESFQVDKFIQVFVSSWIACTRLDGIRLVSFIGDIVLSAELVGNVFLFHYI